MGKKVLDWQDSLELDYEEQQAKVEHKIQRQLPIKTKTGIVYEIEEEEEQSAEEENVPEEESENETEEEAESNSKLITSADLMWNRNKMLEQKKIQIGSLSASILENPTEKLSNLKILIDLLDDKNDTECVTIRKLVVISLLEVFKDILPSYEVKNAPTKDVKLKRETLKLERYESILLQYYKKYLQTISRFLRVLLNRKKVQANSQAEIKLGELSLNAMCDLLCTHPYFNHAENIAQVLIPFLNHSVASVRQKINNTCKSVFAEDKKGEITLKMVRFVNQTIKRHDYKVHSDLIEVLLHLKIKDTNLDKEQENQMKRKKLMSRKGNILRVSKMERKRKVHLEKLDKELLEVKAEENKHLKKQLHTEITKLVFDIFFKILKNSENMTNLDVSLQGIITYAHCINMEFYIDLIKILDNLLVFGKLGYRERQLCIQTIFTILSMQGDAFNIDPTKFYTALYASLLSTDASKNQEFGLLIETLACALVKGRRKISNKRAIAFLKRISTLSLQSLHGETIGCLGIMKSLLQIHKGTDILLDLESSSGEGHYLPELDDPEYCRAGDAALFELTLLNRHYHPLVAESSKYIMHNVPEDYPISKLLRSNPGQLHSDFNMSQMAFNPPVQLPKKFSRTNVVIKRRFSDDAFKKEMLSVAKRARVKI